jgi:hypothetical protein
VNLYKQHVELALKFSEEVVSVVIQKELKPRLQSSKSREANDYRGWEDAVNSLLSGVLVCEILLMHCTDNDFDYMILGFPGR